MKHPETRLQSVEKQELSFCNGKLTMPTTWMLMFMFMYMVIVFLRSAPQANEKHTHESTYHGHV